VHHDPGYSSWFFLNGSNYPTVVVIQLPKAAFAALATAKSKMHVLMRDAIGHILNK
jgi:hypothetical protein